MEENPPIRGRPCKLTTEMALAICQLVQDGNFPAVAAKRHGVGRSTFQRWLSHGKTNPDSLFGVFRDMLYEAIAFAEAEALKGIRDQGILDAKHLEWFLERRFPERWGKNRPEWKQLVKEMAELRKAVEVGKSSQKTAEGSSGSQTTSG